jgi:hypothetical protein
LSTTRKAEKKLITKKRRTIKITSETESFLECIGDVKAFFDHILIIDRSGSGRCEHINDELSKRPIESRLAEYDSDIVNYLISSVEHLMSTPEKNKAQKLNILEKVIYTINSLQQKQIFYGSNRSFLIIEATHFKEALATTILKLDELDADLKKNKTRLENIYEAAIKQDLKALKQAIVLGCIDEWKRGCPFFSAAFQCALEKNIAASEFLLEWGANINYVAMGAAQGGDREYAEALMRRGAGISWVARGAALRGDIEYAKKLIGRGADINDVAKSAVLGGHRKFAEELIAGIIMPDGTKCCADINFVAWGAAVVGDRDYAEELIQRGAHIDFVAWGAAIGEDRDYAEKYADELIGRGADIGFVGIGAAQGGHRGYAVKLLGRSPDIINEVARCAAQGGYREFAEELIAGIIMADGTKRHANINNVAQGAAAHRGYAEELIRRGADIKGVVIWAVNGKHISKSTESQIAYLSFYPADRIPIFTEACKRLDIPVLIDEQTEKRAIAISKHIHKSNLGYSQALVRTDPACNGLLYLLMLMAMNKTAPFPGRATTTTPLLPLEIWRHIFNFLTPVRWDKNDFENLGFVMGRTYLCAQLASYQSSWSWGHHKERACSFFQAVSTVSNKHDMQGLISKQVQVLQGNNPYELCKRDQKYKTNTENPIPDKYHAIVGFWETMRTGQEVAFKDEQSSSSTKRIMK